jgi:PAS domain S-box-containing protein
MSNQFNPVDQPDAVPAAVTIGKVLVVDDEPNLRNILVQSLRAQNYDAHSAASGPLALEKLATEDFDLLLSDLMMPEMDGLALLQRALEIDPHLVGIMMTGQGTIQTAVEAMKRGAFDYVLKPFRLEAMMPVLTRAMNTRHLRLENVQLREAVAIHELSQTIAFTLDPQVVLSKLADGALQQSGADEVSVLLPTADGQQLYVAAVRGAKRERLLGERIPFDRSIASWVGHQLLPLILNGTVEDDRFEALWPRPEIRSSVSVPMQVANRLVGVLNLNVVDRPRRFTLGQMKALSILAGTAAAALESASLYSQLQQAEANYRAIFENSIAGIFQATHDGRYVNANPAMARILGYDSPADLIDSITNIARQVFVDPEMCAYALDVMKTRGSIKDFEVEAYRKGGEKIWLSMNIRSVGPDGEQEPDCEGTVEDITERKRVEEDLRKLSLIIEHSRDLIGVASPDGPVLFLNPAGKKLVGLHSDEQVRTTHLTDYVAAEDKHRIAEILPAVLSEGHWEGELSFRNFETGESIPMLQHAFLIAKDKTNPSPVLATICRDITERKGSEEALHASHQLIEGIINSLPVGVFWKDKDLVYLGCNTTFARDAGLSDPKEVIGKNDHQLGNKWADAYRRDDRDVIETGRMRLLREEPSMSPAGAEITILTSKIPLRDSNGDIAGVIGTYIDITELKRTEAELRFQKSLSEAQTEASIDGILVVSRDREILSYNQRFVELWGVPEAALGGRSDQSALQSVIDKVKDREKFLDGIEYLYNHPEENIQDEIQLTDGRTFDRYSASIESAEGEYYGRVWFFHDITERKAAENALRESEERYRDLVENAQDIIYSHDLQGNYTSSNRAGEEITGYSLEESLKLSFQQTIAPEFLGMAREMVARKLAGENTTAYELDLIAKDGHRVPVEVNTRLVMQDGIPVGVNGIARDITERKQADAVRRRQEEELRARNEELVRFNDATVGREMRVIELKQEVNNLLARLGQPRRYALAFMDATAAEIVRTTPKPVEAETSN